MLAFYVIFLEEDFRILISWWCWLLFGGYVLRLKLVISCCRSMNLRMHVARVRHEWYILGRNVYVTVDIGLRVRMILHLLQVLYQDLTLVKFIDRFLVELVHMEVVDSHVREGRICSGSPEGWRVQPLVRKRMKVWRYLILTFLLHCHGYQVRLVKGRIEITVLPYMHTTSAASQGQV